MPRPAKPLGLHLMQGTLHGRKARREKREAELTLKPGSLGDCPEWMSPEGKEEWTRLATDEEYSQILAPVHRGLLIHLCTLHGKFVRSVRGMKAWADGKESESETEVLTSSEGNLLHSCRMQLGLTPASQAKVKTAPKQQAKSPWAALRD